jgi:nuclear factor related to kappa-B-binding protein
MSQEQPQTLTSAQWMNLHQKKRKVVVQYPLKEESQSEDYDSEGGNTTDASIELEQEEHLYQSEFFDYQLSDVQLQFDPSKRECIKVGKEEIDIPFEILNRQVFDEIFSMETWNNLLSEEQRIELLKLLPDKSVISALFSKENFHFSNPLDIFFNQLKRLLLHFKILY